MSLSFDPQIETALKAAMAGVGEVVQPPRGDALALRAGLDTLMGEMKAASPERPNVASRQFKTTAGDGAALDMHWFPR